MFTHTATMHLHTRNHVRRAWIQCQICYIHTTKSSFTTMYASISQHTLTPPRFRALQTLYTLHIIHTTVRETWRASEWQLSQVERMCMKGDRILCTNVNIHTTKEKRKKRKLIHFMLHPHYYVCRVGICSQIDDWTSTTRDKIYSPSWPTVWSTKTRPFWKQSW